MSPGGGLVRAGRRPGLGESAAIGDQVAREPSESRSGAVIPQLETERLAIRPFAMGDLEDVCRLFASAGADAAASAGEWEQWLRWTVLGYEQLSRLHQPPYGERAVVLRSTGVLIGA